MTLGNKLAKLRKENNYTQEQLAELLGVSRQAISKWESDAAYPETEKLIRLGKLYNCSMDYLLLDEVTDQPKMAVAQKLDLRSLCFERVSKRMVGNLPLWHINIGYGRTAKGIFAMGFVARGIFSMGLISMGVVSFGVLSAGLLALGCLAVGLLALGAISAGILAVGAVAMGIFAFGALAMGLFSIGGLSIGSYAAFGDVARGAIAIGKSEAHGTLFQAADMAGQNHSLVTGKLEELVPWYLSFFKNLFLMLLR